MRAGQQHDRRHASCRRPLARHGLAAVLAASSASFSHAALAQAEPSTPAQVDEPAAPPPPPRVLHAEHGFVLGARLAYSWPVGALGTPGDGLGSYISDLETAAVPLAVDAGYLLRRWFYLGGSIAWAPGIGPNTPGPCESPGVHCFRQDVQALVDARLFFAPEAHVTGWLSVDAGWELATFASSVGGSTTTATFSGPVLFDGRIGFEVRSAPVAIGPYFGVAVGEFVTHGISPSPSPPRPTWIGTASHEWVSVGLKGTYGPW